MSAEYKDISEAFSEVEFTSSVIECSKGHEISVLKCFKGEEDQFSKDWIDSFSGKCPRCQSDLKFSVCGQEVYDRWSTREDRFHGHE